MAMDDSAAAAISKLQKKIKKLEASGDDAARLQKLQKKLKKLSSTQGGGDEAPKSAGKRPGDIMHCILLCWRL